MILSCWRRRVGARRGALALRTGESACASPENFDTELAREIARQNAVNKVWPLMCYELRSRLATS